MNAQSPALSSNGDTIAPLVPPRSPAHDRARALTILRRHGRDVTSFQTLEPGISYFFDGPDAFVAYTDTGSAWVTAGGPVAPPERVAHVLRAFITAAKAAARRVSFFALSSDVCEIAALPCTRIGVQPTWDPSAWSATLARASSLRYQVKRAAKKGVRVRRLHPLELAPGSHVRDQIAELAARWQASQSLAPMGFLVELDPFSFARERMSFVAELDGRVVGFLGAVPIYARSGWFFEDILRAPDAPNGTTELLLDHAMRLAADDGAKIVSLGLAPLAGDVSAPLRVSRELGRGLYDFRGLHAYKSKLAPSAWEPLLVAAAPGRSEWIALADALVAFARGSVLRFALETMLRPTNARLTRLAAAAAFAVAASLVAVTMIAA